MPEQGDAERFAAAEEQGRSPRSVADPGLARDLEIAAMLRSRAGAYTPRDDERARVRARVMAQLAGGPAPGATAQLPPVRPAADPFPESATEITTQLHIVKDEPVETADAVTAGGATLAHEAGMPVPAAARPGRRARSGRHTMPDRPAARARSTRLRPGRRLLASGAAALIAIVAVAAGGVFASRNALPGDTLYGVKRAAESVGDVLTLGEAARAQRNLDAATTRLDEVRTLATRDPADRADVDPAVVGSTMRDFDASTADGARALFTAQDTADTGALARLRTWAAEQVTKLTQLRSSLPASARPDTDGSITLLERLVSRVDALAARQGCPDVTSGSSDDLGPLPATAPCAPRAGTGPGTPAPGTSRAGTAGRPSAPSGQNGPAEPGTTPDGQEPGLLPGVGAPTDGGGQGSSTATTSPTTAPSGPATVLPLPGLPPINLPPLVPGGNGVRIG
jgi:Domain of unknown function (DUF5667)